MFCFANVFNAISLARENRHLSDGGNKTAWYDLDPNEIARRWDRRVSLRDLRAAGFFFQRRRLV